MFFNLVFLYNKYFISHLIFIAEKGGKAQIIGAEGIEQFCDELGVDPDDVSLHRILNAYPISK